MNDNEMVDAIIRVAYEKFNSVVDIFTDKETETFFTIEPYVINQDMSIVFYVSEDKPNMEEYGDWQVCTQWNRQADGSYISYPLHE